MASQSPRMPLFSGGSVACAWLLRHVGSFQKFMAFFKRVPAAGWANAFEAHFDISLMNFYERFAKEISKAPVNPNAKDDWFSFMRDFD